LKQIWRYKPNALLPEGTQLPDTVKRFAAIVEYDGSRYCGWQRQSHSPSVQQEVEAALSKVADTRVTVACCGRTDTGVHATNQVIHFDTQAKREAVNWQRGGNVHLPDDISLRWVAEVSGHFHARFGALSRTYRYLILNREQQPALLRQNLTWISQPLDVDVMCRAALSLHGEQDFSAFRASGCQSVSPFRHVDSTRVWQQGELVVFEITANAFLYHMVRNLAGSLIAVGLGARGPQWIETLLDSKDRTLAEPTAPANGLYLVAAEYPSEFCIANLSAGPGFI